MGNDPLAKLLKTLEYRRARFLDDSQNLEQLVRNAWGLFPTQTDRTVTHSDDKSLSGLRKKDFGGNGIAVHCARFTDGQGVGTIATAPVSEVDVQEQAPNHGENFLNSDLMAVIGGNHVICMNCGRNAGSLRIYLQQLFRKANFPDASRQFEIVRIGSPDKLAAIQTLGVSKIDLKVDISETTAAELLEQNGGGGIWSSVTHGIGEVFHALTARDDTVEQLRLAEKGSVTVSINVPNNDLATAKNGLDEFAEDIVEDEESDSFVIHLRGGRTIKSDEVSVRKSVRIEATANSVSVYQS